MEALKVKDLKKILKNLSDDVEIKFEDCAGNWTFSIYQSEIGADKAGNEYLYLIGEED